MQRFSTGLRAGLLTASSLKALLQGGKLLVFSGAVPASADAATTGATLLLTVNPESGLQFEALLSEQGYLEKLAPQVWSASAATSGTPTFYRVVPSADDGTSASTTMARVQGEVGVGKEMQFASNTLTAAEVYVINYYAVTLLDG